MLASFWWVPPLYAQSVFDAVDECDILAANPLDPERMAEGVSDDAIIPRLAVSACESAVKAAPAELRFAYQLGRAHLAAGHKDAAEAQLKRAAQGSYAAAFAAQADMGVDSVKGQNLHELVNTTDSIRVAGNALKSFAELHGKALQGGYAASQHRMEMLSFDATIYTHKIVGEINRGDFNAARQEAQKPDVRAYLYTFITNIISQCGPVIDAQTVARLAAYRFGGSITTEQEDSPAVGIQALVGEIDAQRFVKRHGCDGPVPQIVLFLPLSLYLEMP